MTTDGYQGQPAIAKAIATLAHKGQVDKAGEPYIRHPWRVVGLIDNPTNQEAAVAWLHDVLEDSSFTAEDLIEAGIDSSIVADVERLTHLKNESAQDYYNRVNVSYTARRVKRADITDNTSLARLTLLDDAVIVRLVRKYAKARQLLIGSK